MKNQEKVAEYISVWLKDYATKCNSKGFVIGISGGIDSALTSTLCAKTGLNVFALTLPIRQTKPELERAFEHVHWLKNNFPNVTHLNFDLSELFSNFESLFTLEPYNHLSMANARSRLRMTTLYSVAQNNNCLVAGTGNKVEDFGVGFYTKYGDGGVDVSPIADLMKSEVTEIARALGVVESILIAPPTDGLWEDGRSDEDQIGATYPELEWAMCFTGNPEICSKREQEVLQIYNRYNKANQHKMVPIPVCTIPIELK